MNLPITTNVKDWSLAYDVSIVAPVDCMMSAHVFSKSPSPNLLDESTRLSSGEMWNTFLNYIFILVNKH